MNEYKENHFKKLPSGISPYDILKTIQSNQSLHSIEPPFLLTELLSRISHSDIEKLQLGVNLAAKKYKYYQFNASLTEIPTSKSYIPNGGAIKALIKLLSIRKDKGILEINKLCKVIIH